MGHELKTTTNHRAGNAFEDADADPYENFKPLSGEEVRALVEKNPSLSPWRVIALQVGAGVLVALAAWALTGSASAGWSAGYGALAVALPAAVFARGLTGRLASINPASALVAFFVWEMVKVALTFAMLVAAPRLIAGLSWPAMLVGLAVALQVYWMALVFVPKRKAKTRK